MKISRDPFAKRGLKLVINTIFPRSKILSPSYPPLLLPHLSLSLPFSLHIPHLARPLACSLSFLLTFPRSRSHQWPVSLARTASPIRSSFSRTTRARIQFLSAKTAGPRVRVSKQTRRTCVLHWRDDITFYPNSPPPLPSSIFHTWNFPFPGDENDEFSQLWNSYPTSERTFYIVTLNALTNEYFIADDYFCIFISL